MDGGRGVDISEVIPSVSNRKSDVSSAKQFRFPVWATYNAAAAAAGAVASMLTWTRAAAARVVRRATQVFSTSTTD